MTDAEQREHDHLAEYDVVTARLKTRALIDEADPVLQDLRTQLLVAKRLLVRLDDAVEGLT